jgi:energy-coupling factor transporter ATP-binding protein EcfA2
MPRARFSPRDGSCMAQVLLEKVTKIYPGNVKAVDAVDLSIRDQEFVVLVGPSGCGKSTTLRMVAGLEEITGGVIRIGQRRGDQDRGSGGERCAAQESRYRDGVSELRLVPAHDGVQEHGVRAEAPRHAQSADPAARGGGGQDPGY